MSTDGFANVRTGAVALALTLLACGAACAAPTTEPDSCIAGETVIGCQTEKDLEEIASFKGDSEAMRKSVFDSIVSGKCKVFRDREPVVVTDRTFVSERRLVHRPNDASSYWMPAKSTRPIGECGTTMTVAKPVEPPREPSPAHAAPVRQATSAQTKPAKPEPAACEIKPVMSDEDLAACRQTRR